MNRKSMIFGLILVILGLLLFLSRFNIDLFAFVFPVGLIALGAWFIMRHRDRERGARGDVNFQFQVGEMAEPSVSAGAYSQSQAGQSASWSTRTKENWSTASPMAEAGRLKYSKFLGDMHIDCANVNLQNVEISMFVGDLQVNLKGGKLAPGLNRMIISGFLGDVMIFVPNGMPVYCHCSEFAGDLEVMGKRSSGFGNTLDSQTDNYESAEAKLYVAASHFIGDIRVFTV
jgi:predicted membrane protein